MSDFLQFVDRIPTLPNRKKITHADSSVEYATIEYADEPEETGTPLSKSGFGRLNAVLGYNKLTPLQETEQVLINGNITNIVVNQSEVQSGTNTGATVTKTSNGSFNVLGNLINYSLSVYFDNNVNTTFSKTIPQSTTNPPDVWKDKKGFSMYVKSYNSTRTGKMRATLTLDKLVGINIKSTAGSWNDYNSRYEVSDYDTTALNLPSVTYYDENNNVVDGTEINVKKIELYCDSFPSNAWKYFVFSIERLNFYTQGLSNKYNDNLIPNFIDNQIYNINPTNVPSGSVGNSFNGISIDTLLEQGKHYELLYDQPNDRFIAEEVRNAN